MSSAQLETSNTLQCHALRRFVARNAMDHRQYTHLSDTKRGRGKGPHMGERNKESNSFRESKQHHVFTMKEYTS
jgi:hypothetical protein